MIKIVADENIPQIEHYLGDQGHLILKPGRLISRDDLLDADVLLVRSVTKVNQALLQETAVKFVGSTVAGLDHLDLDFLKKSHIDWYAAEGCNAVAVAEYVYCVVAALQKKGLLNHAKKRAAVIGVGRVGQWVVEKLKTLGFEVLTSDPLRAKTEKEFVSIELNKIEACDLICLHTPLTHEGNFPTYHLIEKNFLARQKEGCVLLNAGRGSVISFADLKKEGRHLRWCLDVFPHEPEIDLEVVEQAEIVTPHIAGHTVQSKLRGLEMVYREMKVRGFLSEPTKAFFYPEKTVWVSNEKMDQREMALQIFDPQAASDLMKRALLAGTETFDELRVKMGGRDEFLFVKRGVVE